MHPDESLAFGQDVEAGAVVPDGGIGPHAFVGVAHGRQIRWWGQPAAGPLPQRQLAQRAPASRGRGGLTLIIVLVLLLIIGAAIGLGLAYVTNIQLWPSPTGQ